MVRDLESYMLEEDRGGGCGQGCGQGCLMVIILGTLGVIYLGLNTSEVDEKKVDFSIQEKNVRWGEAPERFYDTPEGRAYLKIDGKPVDSYSDFR